MFPVFGFFIYIETDLCCSDQLAKSVNRQANVDIFSEFAGQLSEIRKIIYVPH
jgi:hypothetical protein